MAPLDGQLSAEMAASSSSLSSFLYPIFASFLVAISMILVVLMCCCCGGGDEKKGDEEVVFYSVDPSSHDYCPDCAHVAQHGMQTSDSYYDGGENGGGVGGDGRTERYGNGGGGAASMAPSVRDAGGGPAESVMNESRRPEGSRMPDVSRRPPNESRRPDASRMQHRFKHRESSPPKEERSDRTEAPEVKTDPSVLRQAGAKGGDPQEFKSTRNPAYKTLFDAKSNVFDKTKGKGGAVGGATDDQMRAAQVNPAYKTLYGAQSNVFDRTGGKTGGAKGAPNPTQKNHEQPADDSRMKAAQANPAYKTLYGAESKVFDRKK